MNVLKIQQDILKLLFQKNDVVIFHHLRDGSGTAVGTKNAIFVIPTDEFFLNLSGAHESNAIERFIDYGFFEKNYKRAEPSYQILNKEKYSTIQVVLVDYDGDKCAIDKKYYKYFGKDDNFYIAGRKEPIIVYDMDNLEMKAFIFPVVRDNI